MVILQDPSVFCISQIELNADIVGITTLASFQSLMVALISAVPLRMLYCFRFTIYYIPWQVQFLWLPFGLSHHNSPRSTGQGNSMSMCIPIMYLVAEYIDANYEFQTREITTRWIWGPTRRVVR